MRIRTKDLELVDLRVYRKDLGVEVDLDMPKAIVRKNPEDGLYYNVVTKEEKYPLMERVPYSSYTSFSTEFGTKLNVINKKAMKEQGICGIIVDNDFIREIKQNMFIEQEELEEKILKSSMYFKDRIKIVEERINSTRRKRKYLKIARNDWDKNCHYEDVVASLNEDDKKSSNVVIVKKKN